MAAMEAAGKKADLYEAYTAGEQDYTALVTKLKNDGIGVVYVGGYHPEAGLIKRQMVEQGMDAVMVSGDALVTKEFWEITGDAGAGTLMTFSPDPRKDAANAEIVKKFTRRRLRPGGLHRSTPTPPSRLGSRRSRRPARPSTRRW